MIPREGQNLAWVRANKLRDYPMLSRYLLGDDGDPVIVYLGSDSEQVDSVINRSANANGSVRIVGNNRRIADWFQQHFKLGDVVEAKVQDPQHVLLMLPRDA